MNRSSLLYAILLTLPLSACTVGPDYQSPQLDQLPDDFRHASGWQPVGAVSPALHGDWWRGYEDPLLDQLLRQLERDSPDLAQADARLRQAQAELRAVRAGRAPTVGAEVSVMRAGAAGSVANSYDAGVSISWLADVWGRVRRQVEAGEAQLQSSEADLAAVRLALQANLAQQYVRVRVLDQQRLLLSSAEEAYRRSLQLTSNQYAAGLAARADVVQAEVQLADVQAQLLALVEQRALAENAIAALAGQPPSILQIDVAEGLPQQLEIAGQVPAALLVRRPDVVGAERRVAAANARIGVAEAAWLPDLTLGLSGGYRSSSLQDWFDVPSRVWALGPSLALTLFDGGARDAERQRQLALHDEAAAAWRAAVLTALREVEDALARLGALQVLAEQQQRVLALAEESERLVDNRYRAGLVSFLEVAVAQNTTLAARRALVEIQGQSLEAGVQLVIALGGGWPGLAAQDQ